MVGVSTSESPASVRIAATTSRAIGRSIGVREAG